MIQFDEHIFQMGWFNHQPVTHLLIIDPNFLGTSKHPRIRWSIKPGPSSTTMTRATSPSRWDKLMGRQRDNNGGKRSGEKDGNNEANMDDVKSMWNVILEFIAWYTWNPIDPCFIGVWGRLLEGCSKVMYTYIHECRKYYAHTQKATKLIRLYSHIYIEKAQPMLYDTNIRDGTSKRALHVTWNAWEKAFGTRRTGISNMGPASTWDPPLPISWTYIISIHQGIRRWESEHLE